MVFTFDISVSEFKVSVTSKKNTNDARNIFNSNKTLTDYLNKSIEKDDGFFKKSFGHAKMSVNANLIIDDSNIDFSQTQEKIEHDHRENEFNTKQEYGEKIRKTVQKALVNKLKKADLTEFTEAVIVAKTGNNYVRVDDDILSQSNEMSPDEIESTLVFQKAGLSVADAFLLYNKYIRY